MSLLRWPIFLILVEKEETLTYTMVLNNYTLGVSSSKRAAPIRKTKKKEKEKSKKKKKAHEDEGLKEKILLFFDCFSKHSTACISGTNWLISWDTC